MGSTQSGMRGMPNVSALGLWLADCGASSRPEIQSGPGDVLLVNAKPGYSRMPPTLLVAIAFMLAAFVGAPAVPAEHTIVVRTFTFRPDTLVVTPGSRVTWANEDEIEHTITADSGITGIRLTGALRGKGSSFLTVFESSGIYPYHCDRHAFMRGVVRVTTPGVRP